MKSVNVKRIAATTIGAAMVGAAFAGAVAVDPTIANFKFFDGGSPNVRIVVGVAAQPSDAVAAANIAAMIGNLAYTSKDITVLGTDLLSCGEGGACAITGKTTTLTVTTPGVSPDVAYQMKNYIGGYLDYDVVDDRSTDLTGATTILDSDGVTGGRKVTNYESPQLVKKVTVTDTSVGKSYVEEERYFLYAYTPYDTSSKSVKAKNCQIAYEAQFVAPIQVCTEYTPDNSTCSDTYKTTKHRVKIKFLGQDWIIYEMNNFVSTTAQTSGSTSMVIGKEVQYKEFMQLGDEVTAPNGIKIKLTDISGIATGTQYQPPVSFKIYDAQGNEIDTATLQEGGTAEYEKHGIIIHLWKAFAGIGQTAYAQVSIFSDKLTLTDGNVVDAQNTQWQVNLVGGGTAYGHSISRIQLMRVVIDDLAKDDSVGFITKPTLMKFSYKGLEDVTYDTLTLATGDRNFPTSSTDTETTGLNFVRVSSSLTTPFDFGAARTNIFYYVVDPTAAGSGVPGAVFYQDPSTGYFVPYNHTNARGYISQSSSTPFTFSGTGILGTTAPASALCGGNNSVTAVTGAYRNATGGNLTTIYYIVNNTAAVSDLTQIVDGPTNLNLNTTTASFTVTLANGTTWTCGGSDAPINYNLVVSSGRFTSGASLVNVTHNFVPYTYASQTVNIVVNYSGVGTGSAPDYDLDVIGIPEYTTTEDSSSYMGAFWFDVAEADTTTPYFGPTTGTAYLEYGDYNTTNAYGGTEYETGFISNRGSVGTVSLTSASLKYATTLAHSVFHLHVADVSAGNVVDKTLKENETALDEGGYKVVVKSIDCTTAGGAAGGECTGTENLAPSESKAYVVTALDTSTSPLVVTDTSPLAGGTQPLIVVGGHLVNTVAASALSGAGLTIDATTEPMVKIIGDKIIVAGWRAEDTQSAANSLIQWLAANKDRLQR